MVAKKPAAKKAPAKKTVAKKTTARKPRENGIVKPDAAAKQAVRRSRTKKAEVEQPRLSFVNVRIGKRTYPLVFDPNCAVCKHPHRALIEEQILLTVQFTALARWVSDRDHETIDGDQETWPSLSPEQISFHFNDDHSPLDAKTVRDLMGQQVDLDEYARVGTRLINGVAFAHRVIGRVEERMVRGELEPTFKDATAMARLTTAVELAKVQAEHEDGPDQSWFVEQSFDRFFHHAKRIMSEEQHSEFMNVLRADPILRDLYERRENPTNPMEEQTA